MGPDGDLHAEGRGDHRGAKQGLVALVIRVGHQGHTGGYQLGPGGGDEDVVAVGTVEGQRVVGAGAFPVL